MTTRLRLGKVLARAGCGATIPPEDSLTGKFLLARLGSSRTVRLNRRGLKAGGWSLRIEREHGGLWHGQRMIALLLDHFLALSFGLEPEFHILAVGSAGFFPELISALGDFVAGASWIIKACILGGFHSVFLVVSALY